MSNLFETLDVEKLYSPTDLMAMGWSRNDIYRHVNSKLLISPANGVFHHSAMTTHELADHLVLAKRFPDAVFHLYSAAHYHGITQSQPSDLWVMAPAARKKELSLGEDFWMPIKTLLSSRQIDQQVGVETINIHGNQVRFTNMERAVIDMWRFSSNSTTRKNTPVRVSSENLYQCLGAYLEKNEKQTALAETFSQLDLGENAKQEFYKFVQSYSHGFNFRAVF